jgi:TRAP-type mannitol/chloroaromatic compound transport system permease large subunit
LAGAAGDGRVDPQAVWLAFGALSSLPGRHFPSSGRKSAADEIEIGKRQQHEHLRAVLGVIGGEVTLLGIIALPQLLRLGYDRKLSIGMVCAGGALGSMIPPSLILVFFGLAGNVSIGDLLLASVLPGLLMAGLYCAYILVMCNLYPAMGPIAPLAERDVPFLGKLKLLKGLALPVLIIFCVMGSIYAGFASVTESAALGVIGVLFSVWVRGELSMSVLWESLKGTMAICGNVFWLVFGANALRVSTI